MAVRGGTTIDNSADVIDSRDVIDRIDNLDGTEDESEQEELKALLALQEEAQGYSEDWRYGSPLIRDSYFEAYAEELADDMGAIDRNAGWPLTCIDWEKAADELKQDYTSVEFDGVTYWIR
jgi:hypothetical protein